MHVLLTNDDGYESEGLLALKQAMEQVAQVDVLAPERNWSASGHSRILHRPLTVRQVQLPDGSPALVSDGAPSDCVALALMGILPQRPDLVVSGINHGPNMGSDVTYSGTVAAAMEAVLLDLPGIAISLESFADWKFETAAEIARRLIPKILQRGLPQGVLLNVNVPNLPLSKIQGLAITRLGRRIYRSEWEMIQSDEGAGWQRYRLNNHRPTAELIPGTDLAATAAGYVSITPLHLDLTEHRLLEEMLDWEWDLPKTP
ncbi:MAG: 5'/3'-nucleotidase SurE [Chloroflexia bacterium]|nr:5'/3'-nucleotidase SurE [Chloroflexia bacterium]